MTTTREDRERAARMFFLDSDGRAPVFVAEWVNDASEAHFWPNEGTRCIQLAAEFAALRERAEAAERERDEARICEAAAMEARANWQRRAAQAEQRAAGLEGALRNINTTRPHADADVIANRDIVREALWVYGRPTSDAAALSAPGTAPAGNWLDSAAGALADVPDEQWRGLGGTGPAFRGPQKCTVHGNQEHGREAEELRHAIEELIKGVDDATTVILRDDVQAILDRIDARDSLAFLEAHDAAHRREAFEEAVQTIERVRLRWNADAAFRDAAKEIRALAAKESE